MREKRDTEIDRLINTEMTREAHRQTQTNTQTHAHTHTHTHTDKHTQTQTHAHTHKERGSDSVVTSKSDKSTKIDTNKNFIKYLNVKK